MKILVIGAGYIGKKHCINLKELGADVSVYDTNPEVMAWCIQEGFEWVEEIKGDYDGAVIATPPEFHTKGMDTLIDIGIKNLLIEKPLALFWSTSGDRYRDMLLSLNNNIMMAHNYLFDEALYEFRRSNMIVLQANRRWDYISWDYMPNWHGITFLEGYKDRHEAVDGCGAISMPHAIYIMDYLFGLPDKEKYYKMRNPKLDIKGDTSVSGIRINENSIVTSVEDWSHKEQRVHQLIDVETRKVLFDWTKSDILGSYKRMMNKFLQVIKGESEIPPLCRLEEGIRITQQIEKMEWIENEYI